MPRGFDTMVLDAECALECLAVLDMTVKQLRAVCKVKNADTRGCRRKVHYIKALNKSGVFSVHESFFDEPGDEGDVPSDETEEAEENEEGVNGSDVEEEAKVDEGVGLQTEDGDGNAEEGGAGDDFRHEEGDVGGGSQGVHDEYEAQNLKLRRNALEELLKAGGRERSAALRVLAKVNSNRGPFSAGPPRPLSALAEVVKQEGIIFVGQLVSSRDFADLRIAEHYEHHGKLQVVSAGKKFCKSHTRLAVGCACGLGDCGLVNFNFRGKNSEPKVSAATISTMIMPKEGGGLSSSSFISTFFFIFIIIISSSSYHQKYCMMLTGHHITAG